MTRSALPAYEAHDEGRKALSEEKVDEALAFANKAIDLFPQAGKYHMDGHRKCHVCLKPEETIEREGLCPVCGKPLVQWVVERSARAQELAGDGVEIRSALVTRFVDDSSDPLRGGMHKFANHLVAPQIKVGRS